MSKSQFTKTAAVALAALLSVTGASVAAEKVAPQAAPAEAAAAVAVEPAAPTAPADTTAQPAAEQAAAPSAAPEAAAPEKTTATAPPAAPAAAPASQLKAAELSLGAMVFGADGKDVGKIVRISSAANGSVTEIQIDAGSTGVVVVPGNAIANGGAKVKLSLTSDQVGKLPSAGDKNG